jgi:hypothetical protein
MTRHIPCIAVVTAMTSLSFAAAASELTTGEALPELRGEYLSGRKAILPKDAAGRVALLLFGFTYQSRFAVEAWTKRFRGDFEKNPQVTFYEIPMIGGMARLGKWFIDSGMRRGTPKTDHENVITVYGGTEAWKQRVGLKEEDYAYLVIIDPKGRVAWRQAGPFEETSYQVLAGQVRKLASAQ